MRNNQDNEIVQYMCLDYFSGNSKLLLVSFLIRVVNNA